MSLAKPAIRNLLMEKTKKDFVIAVIGSIAVAAAYKFGVQEQRRNKFTAFYETYDAQKDYKRMKAAGVFQCLNREKEE